MSAVRLLCPWKGWCKENCGVMTVVGDVNFAIRFVEIAKIYFGTQKSHI